MVILKAENTTFWSAAFLSYIQVWAARKDGSVMAEYEKRVRDILSEHGRSFHRRGKSDHDIWYSPITKRHVTVDTKIKSRHTANAILKQSGIDFKGITPILGESERNLKLTLISIISYHLTNTLHNISYYPLPDS